MKRFYNCIRLIICVLVLFGILQMVHAQRNNVSTTQLLDSLITNKAYKVADSVLTIEINNLRQQQAYFDLTQHIYYFGKIALNLNDKDLAIKKTNEFATSITDATDSLTVSRKKHLVLARFYALLRDYKNASEHNLKALEVTKKMPDATGDLFGLIHHNLSIDYGRLGDLKKATWHSRESIKHYLSYPKSDKSKVLDAYNSMGGRMWDAYKIDSALFYFLKGEKIIDELEQTPINKYYHAAKAQSNISSVYALLGKSADAIKYNEKAIKNYTSFINSNTDGKDFFKEEARLFLYMTIENYADDFSKQGNFKKAKDLIEYVKGQKLKYYPSNDPELGFTNMQLGNIYLKLKEYEKAELLFDEALKNYTNEKPQNNLRIADAYYYKGIIHEFYNDISRAKDYYEKSKVLYEDVFGNNYDAFYLNAMLTYSSFYSKNGYTEKALDMATKAYEYVLNNQGTETILEYSLLVNLADIHYKSKNYDDAHSKINEALELLNTSYSQEANQRNDLSVDIKKPMALLLKSKVEMQLKNNKDIEFLKSQFSTLKEAISILEQQKTIVSEDQNVSIILDDNNEVFEFAKAIAIVLYKQTKDEQYLNEILSLHESKLYNKIRQQLNIQSDFSLEDIPQDILDKEKQLKEVLNSTLNNENEFDEFIKANYNWNDFLETLKQDYPKYYGLRYASISKSLNLNDLNISGNMSIVRYVYIQEDLYAFIIQKNKIGAYQLDNSKLNDILEAKENENKLQEENLSANNNLYNILWQPFETAITTKSVIIIPDANLFNLSFEVLTTSYVNSFKELAEKSLLKKYSISYNYSLLLINKNKTPKFFKNNFVAFTPEFNNQMKSKYKIAIKDSVLLDKTYLTLLPQPFTVDLAKEYSELFGGNSFINEKASKQIFTQQAKEHKIIHIGTHAESNNVSPEFSRLIFAKNLDDSNNTDNNSLYTYEIYNQNLSSNLAILTACETGKPTFQPGEGMISLAHAFNYAGSESILTSLWKIDEQSSAKIIENFYNHLKNGLPKDEALQKAKLDYLSTAEGRTMSPQYWAGLVLIGDASPIDLSPSNLWWIWVLLILILIIGILFFAKNRIVFSSKFNRK
ncbi:CHAT domain-containing protein [Winogradskyella pulchriflava]|uniref:CHAT domain-containing protein n=1 Tax=Winogradskyella pulchriflava TaxID=1110688 RepID=A0ABV6QEE8_9FLAO